MAVSPANGLQAAGVKSVAELTQSPGIKEALQAFTKDRKWIDEQHLALCRIPAPTFLEEKRAEWMAGQLRALDWDAKIDRAGNVVATINGAREGPFVALTAHLDTVIAPRVPEEIRVAADGRFQGPGVSDNGAGLAALLAIARVARGLPVDDWGGSLLFVANVGEEGEGNLSGMRFLCRQSSLASKIKAFVVLDGPTTDHITYEALASRRYELVFSGPGGHSWSDYGVGNPVHAMSRAIAWFASNPAARPGQGPRVSFNFGLVEGGSSINSIPTSARTKVDLRSEDPDRLEELTALLTSSTEAAVEAENDRSTSGRVTARLREIGSRPGGRLSEDSPILRYVRAVDQHLGIRSHLDCASTDANIPLSMGLPAISIGAGGTGGGAHTPQEWFHPEGRELGLRRVLLTLVLLLRSVSSGG
ncbi:MAG: M20/M25/M40 family metallo-hydrolase [Bryobacteraceae bacterium]|nr:M20/M25/M40 family metallo-hydrolase [Bryobacteraceae bacterium]